MITLLTRVPLISCPAVEVPLINTLLHQGDHRLELLTNRFMLTNRFSGFQRRRQTPGAVVRCSFSIRIHTLTQLASTPVRESSVRSAMFIANVPGDSHAPLGAACGDDRAARRSMPLLTELERDSVGWPFYKHGAPNGAFAEAGQCELSGLVELGKLVPGSSRYKQAAPGGAFHTARVELKSFLL